MLAHYILQQLKTYVFLVHECLPCSSSSFCAGAIQWYNTAEMPKLFLHLEHQSLPGASQVSLESCNTGGNCKYCAYGYDCHLLYQSE